MDEEVIKIFVDCDDILKAIGVTDDPQAQMTNAELMSFAIISARLMPSTIRARTQKGFLIRLLSTILAHCISIL